MNEKNDEKKMEKGTHGKGEKERRKRGGGYLRRRRIGDGE